MNLGISGKKALITASGRGIGASIATCLADEGVKVALVSRTATDLEKLLKKIGGKKKGHTAIEMDLSLVGKPQELKDHLAEDFGYPDILVNNLGSTLDIRDPYCSLDDWRAVWRINVEVAIELNNICIPAMKKKKWGRITHIASIAALENQGPVPYCTAKAALNAYVRSMGRIVSADNIIMTSILPGAVLTKGGYWDIISKNNPSHVKKYLRERMASHRLGHPDEIGKVVAFFCSEHASFCVGSAIPVDGGQGRCFF